MRWWQKFPWLVGICLAGCAGAGGDFHAGGSLFHDCGPVFVDIADRESWSVRHDFVFRNPSTQHTAQLEVESESCGCGEPIVHQREVPPGEQTTITLAYTLRPGHERRRESVLLTTGLPEMPRVVVSLAAEGFPRLGIQPDRLPDLKVPPGRTKTFEITVAAHRPESEPREQLETSVQGAGLSLMQVGDQREVRVANGVLRDMATFALEIGMPYLDATSRLEDTYSGALQLRHGSRQLTRPLQWSPHYFVRAGPEQLFLRAGAEAWEARTVRLTAEQPFAISAISADDPVVEWSRKTQGTATEHVIAVRAGTPPAGERAGTSALVVELDHPEHPFVRIPVFVLWCSGDIE